MLPQPSHNPSQPSGALYPQAGGTYYPSAAPSKQGIQQPFTFAAPTFQQLFFTPAQAEFHALEATLMSLDASMRQLRYNLEQLQTWHGAIQQTYNDHLIAEHNWTVRIQNPCSDEERQYYEHVYNAALKVWVSECNNIPYVEQQIQMHIEQLTSLGNQRMFCLEKFAAMHNFAQKSAQFQVPVSKEPVKDFKEEAANADAKSIEVVIPIGKNPEGKTRGVPLKFGDFPEETVEFSAPLELTPDALKDFPSKGSLSFAPPAPNEPKLKQSPKRFHSSLEDLCVENPPSPKYRLVEEDAEQSESPKKRFSLAVAHKPETPAGSPATPNWASLVKNSPEVKRNPPLDIGYKGPSLVFEKAAPTKSFAAGDKYFVDKTQTGKDLSNIHIQTAAHSHIMSRMNLFDFKAVFCKSIGKHPTILDQQLELKNQYKAKQYFVPTSPSLSRNFTKALPEDCERAHVSIIPEIVVGPQNSTDPSTFSTLEAHEVKFGIKHKNELSEILNICDVAHSIINHVDCIVELELRERVIVLLNQAMTTPKSSQEIVNEFAAHYLKELEYVKDHYEGNPPPAPWSYLAQDHTKEFQRAYKELSSERHKDLVGKCIQGMIDGVSEFLKKKY